GESHLEIGWGLCEPLFWRGRRTPGDAPGQNAEDGPGGSQAAAGPAETAKIGRLNAASVAQLRRLPLEPKLATGTGVCADVDALSCLAQGQRALALPALERRAVEMHRPGGCAGPDAGPGSSRRGSSAGDPPGQSGGTGRSVQRRRAAISRFPLSRTGITGRPAAPRPPDRP